MNRNPGSLAALTLVATVLLSACSPAAPAAKPTEAPEPTKTKKPKDKPPKERPPCPSDGAPPPGHDKGNGPSDRPCDGKGKGKGNGHGGEAKGPDGAVFLLVPLAAATSAWSVRPTRLRVRRRRR